jgi:hypothetical protein
MERSKGNNLLIVLAVIALTIEVFALGHALDSARAQSSLPTITAAWIGVDHARIAWSAGGCVRQYPKTGGPTLVACTDYTGDADATAQAGDIFVLEYNDAVHGQGTVETQLAAFCGVFVPVVVAP